MYSPLEHSSGSFGWDVFSLSTPFEQPLPTHHSGSICASSPHTFNVSKSAITLYIYPKCNWPRYPELSPTRSWTTSWPNPCRSLRFAAKFLRRRSDSKCFSCKEPYHGTFIVPLKDPYHGTCIVPLNEPYHGTFMVPSKEPHHGTFIVPFKEPFWKNLRIPLKEHLRKAGSSSRSVSNFRLRGPNLKRTFNS